MQLMRMAIMEMRSNHVRVAQVKGEKSRGARRAIERVKENNLSIQDASNIFGFFLRNCDRYVCERVAVKVRRSRQLIQVKFFPWGRGALVRSLKGAPPNAQVTRGARFAFDCVAWYQTRFALYLGALRALLRFAHARRSLNGARLNGAPCRKEKRLDCRQVCGACWLRCSQASAFVKIKCGCRVLCLLAAALLGEKKRKSDLQARERERERES